MKPKLNPFRAFVAVSAAGLLTLAGGLSARADYSSTVLSYNPSAYWRLNETTPVPPADIAANSGAVGQSAVGYYLNGATHPDTGIPGCGTDTAVLTGNPTGKSQVRVPFQPGLNQAGPFTAEFWAKPATVGATVCPFSSVDFPNRGWLFYQELSAGQWSFRVYKGGANTTITAGTVTGNQWNHVVGVYDGANMSLYVNGQRVAGPTPLGGTYTPVINANISLTMGIRSDNNFAYNGDLDETVLYTNALSDAEVLTHYMAGTNTATADYSAVILPNHPVGYWRLDEPSYNPGTLPVAANSGYLGTSVQGTYQPGVTDGVAGPGYSGLGGATVCTFNSIAGYVDCGASLNDLSAPISQLTIMVWAKFSNTRAMDWESLITCGDTAWELQRPNNDYAVSFRFAGTDVTTPSTLPINDGNWHHIAATYDGAQQKIYIDGTLAVSGNKTGSNAGETTYPILIGENGKFPGRIFRGNLAEMAVFTNALTAGQVQSIYTAAQVPPVITAQPQAPAGTVYEGDTVNLSVTAVGAPTLTYQWTKNGAPRSGATINSLLLSNVTTNDNGSYAVVITNPYGSVTSSVVALTIQGSKPLIVTQPASVTAFVGDSATFSVVTKGTLPFQYQWARNSANIPGATTSSYTVASVQWADGGSTYQCTISNIYGSTNTTAATLTLAPGGEFVSLSLPDTLARDRHTALGSDGSYLYFTHGNVASSAPMYRIPGLSLANDWTSRAPLPMPPTVNADTGVGDLGYFNGSLYCWVTQPSGVDTARVVQRYDIAGDFWVTGARGANDGPNAACSVYSVSNVLGGWMGNTPIYQATDWTNGVMASVATLPGGAVHPWDSCVGPNAVYFIKHYNVAASNAVLVAAGKTATPTFTNIPGVPFNIGMGCAIEYMPASLFSDTHPRLYILRGMTGTTDDDAGEQYGHWVTPTTTRQLASYDLTSQTWTVIDLPFTIDVGSEMSLVNQTLYILAANSDAQPLKMLYLGPALKPVVTGQPVSQTVYLGQSATFNVSVFGGGPYNYQWRKGGATIPGATGNSLTFAFADYTNAANYDVLVSNSAGTTNSQSASLTVLPPPAFANLTNGLVVHLKFEGNFSDSSGNTNDASPFGSPTFVPGKLGQGVELSTVSSSSYNYLQVYDLNNQFEFGATNSFSIAFWLKYTNNFNDLPVIGNAANSTYQPGYVLTEDNNQLEYTLVGVDTGTVIADPVGGPQLNDGAWHQLTVTFDRSQGIAQSFVDGALIDTRSIAGVGSLITGNPLTIGQDPSGAYGVSGTFDLDDVGVWARALATTEAEAIYMVGQKGQSYDSIAPIKIDTRLNGGVLQVIWQAGTLEWSDSLSAPNWTPVPSATPPYYYYTITPGASQKFFRVH